VANSESLAKNGSKPTKNGDGTNQFSPQDAVDILNSALAILKDCGLRVTGANHDQRECGVLFLYSGMRLKDGVVVLVESATTPPTGTG